MITPGARVFGLGIVLLGAVCLAFGDFDFGQSVPKDFPARTALALPPRCSWELRARRSSGAGRSTWAAAALAVYFGFVVVIVMDGRVVVAHYSEFGIYSSVAAQVAVAAGALIVFVAATPRSAPRASRPVTFGICAVLFGGAHFFYMNLTAPLVPKWLPP